MTDTLKEIVEKLKTRKIVKVSKFETCSRDSIFYDDVLSLTLEDNTTIDLTLKAYDMTKPKTCTWKFSETTEKFPIIVCCHGVPEHNKGKSRTCEKCEFLKEGSKK